MPSAEFNTAAEDAKKLPQSPSNDMLLKLYALFKQATVGDNTADRPGVIDIKGRAKWDAWIQVKGTSQQTAEWQYIALVEELKKN